MGKKNFGFKQSPTQIIKVPGGHWNFGGVIVCFFGSKRLCFNPVAVGLLNLSNFYLI